MASTLQIASAAAGSSLGIGIGGHPKEHAAYGIDFPAPPERVARLEEAVAVIRALWTGGPVTRESPFYPLVDAAALSRAGPGAADHHRRRDARPGRGWPGGSATAGRAFDDNFEANLPLYLESLAAAGRRREDQRVLVGFQGDWLGDESIADVALGHARRARLGSAGRRPAPTGRSSSPARPTDIDALVEAAERW